MMKFIHTILLSNLCFVAFSQNILPEIKYVVSIDSIITIESEPLSRNLDFLPKSNTLSEFESKTIKLDNIITCIGMIEIYKLEDTHLEIIFKRLEDFAEYFYQMNEPILIIRTGKNSVELSKKLNQENQIKNLKYISLGNSCLGNDYVEKGIERFNKKTKFLVQNGDGN